MRLYGYIFLVGSLSSILGHHLADQVLGMSEEVHLNNEFVIHPELVPQVSTDLSTVDQFQRYLSTKTEPQAYLQLAERIKTMINKSESLTFPQADEDGQDYFWTHRGWVQRLKCIDSPQFSPPINTSLTSRYGQRINPFNGRHHIHSGVDYRGGIGEPVVAAEGGLVSRAKKKGHYGRTVEITHNNGFTTLYGHLTDYAVEHGDRVIKGQTIGYVGKTGRVTGPHLHFEVRCFDVPVNPLTYLNKKGKKALVSILRQRFPGTTKSYVSEFTPVIKRYPSKQSVVDSQKQVSTSYERRSTAF